jgi:signal transduction histidine kinase
MKSRRESRHRSQGWEHLLALINDVIDVSKIEAGQIEINREEFELHDVITEVTTALAKEIEGKGLELQVRSII